MFKNKDKLLKSQGYVILNDLETFERAVEQDIVTAMQHGNNYIEVNLSNITNPVSEQAKQDLRVAGYNVAEIYQYISPFVEDATETGIRISW